MSEDEKAITSAITNALDRATKSGMVLPFILVAVGTNGAIIAVRYTLNEDYGTLDAEPLMQTATSAMGLPINIMIVDANGEAARLVVRPDGSRVYQ
jgi:hypothetical protein